MSLDGLKNIQNHIPFSNSTQQLGSNSLNAPPESGGKSFQYESLSPDLPSSSVTTNLQNEYNRVKDNIFTTDFSSKHLSRDQIVKATEIRDTLKQGGYLSCAVSGTLAMIISTGVSMVATKFVGGSLASVAVPTCAACGAIGGAGFGAWLAFKFAKQLSDKHPGMAGMALATGWAVLGVPLAIGAYATAGAIGSGAIGMGGSFLMSQAVGFGAFKLSLMVLEPACQHFIGDSHIQKAKEMLQFVQVPKEHTGSAASKSLLEFDESNASKPSSKASPFSEIEIQKLQSIGFSEEDIKDLTKFCKEPLTHSLDYWYNNIFSPPIHDNLRAYMHYPESNKAEAGFIGRVKNVGATIKHATQTALHRATFQQFRAKHDPNNLKDTSGHNLDNPFDKLSEIANTGGFSSANQAWENFHQIERRFGRSDLGKEAAGQAKAAIMANYGPEPTLLETLTCGLCVKGRLTDLLALAQLEAGTDPTYHGRPIET